MCHTKVACRNLRKTTGHALGISVANDILLPCPNPSFFFARYASLTVACVRMLHCVWVPGTPPSERRLFIRGTVVCDYTGWQLPFILLVLLLVGTPLLLPLLAAWSMRSPREGEGSLKMDARAGVRRALVESYRHQVYVGNDMDQSIWRPAALFSTCSNSIPVQSTHSAYMVVCLRKA